MVSNVASVCMCVSGVGFDREVENWRMSLRSELVAVEALEQLVTPAPALCLKCQDPESRGSSHTFPLRRNAGRLIRGLTSMPPCRVLTVVLKRIVAMQCFSVETKAT